MAFAPKLPVELTSNWWQKSTGTFAKLAADGRSIGKLLDEVEAKFKQVDWRKLDVKPAANANRSEIEQGYEDAMKEVARLEALVKVIDQVEGQARKVASVWSKDKLVPAAATKAAADVGKAAARATADFGQIQTTVTRERDAALKQATAVQKQGANEIRTLQKGLEVIRRTGKTVTLAGWASFWKATVESSGKTLKTLVELFPALKPESDAWRPFFPSMPRPRDERDLQKLLEQLGKAAQSTEARIGKLNI